jgi:CHAT domain-containing protein
MADVAHRRRFEHPVAAQARLGDLAAAVARERIPVLLYWSTWPLTVAWLITPEPATVRSDARKGARAADQVNVRSIALSEPVLVDRIRRVRASASEEGAAFDVEAARQLYLFLIAPFEGALGQGQIMIVPQGALTDLPFETLIDTQGHFLVERWAVSYAPSATMAAEAMSRPGAVPLRVAAIQDETIASSEIENLGHVPTIQLTVVPADRAGIADLAGLAERAPVLHVLAHGTFNDDDPLLSELKLREPVFAADFLSLGLGRTRMVVLSACEGATQYRRLSNELFGFPWALQVAGVQNAAMSRWSVPSEANAIWIPAFYAGLGQGLSPANAAARASRAMLASGDRDPHRWAAMQVLGR